MDSPSVLLIVNSLAAGGAERVTIGLYEYLKKTGFDAHLFVTSCLPASKKVYDISQQKNVHQGGTCSNRAIRALQNILSLSILLKRLNPSWVVSLGASYGLLDACNVFRKTKTILSERNWPPSFYSEKSFLRVSEMYRKADVVVFQTRDAANCYPEDIQKKGVIISNPAPTGLPAWSGIDSKNIIYYGRLDSQKNPQMAIKAFAVFSEVHPDYKLEVYGSGSEKESAIQLAKELGISSKVGFYQPDKNIHKIASKSLMYINTSEYEGISNAMLEALSMGMPCVCTDCAGGGAQLAIRDGENGLLVPRGDAQAMARAMSRVADSDVYARKLGTAAQASMERFVPDAIYGRWLEILEDGLRVGDKKC